MIEIKIDAAQVAGALERLAKAAVNASPVMASVAGIMHDAVMENFAQAGRPKWLGLKPATLAQKRKLGYSEQPLIRRGRLASSITQKSDGNSAIVGTNLKYAAIHQFGGGIDMPARSQQAYFRQGKDGSIGHRFVRKSQSNFAQWHTRGAHSVNMPARPFLSLTEADEEKIVRKVSDYLRQVIG